MRFAYITAALLGLAYANPVIQAPEESSLDLLDARDAEDLVLLDERDDDIDVMDAFDGLFTALEEREAEAEAEPEADFEDEVEEEFSVIEARSAGSILKSLKKISKQAKAINSALNKVSKKNGPSNSQAVKIQQISNKLASAVSSATKKTKSSKKLSKKQSKKVFNYVNGGFKKTTINSLNNFKSHAPGFKKKGFGNLVKSRLSSLKGSANKLGKALISKSGTKKIKKKGKKVNNKIQSAFSKAIKAY